MHESAAHRFERTGFAVLPGFLAAAELGDARRRAGAALAKPLPPGCDRPHNTLAPLRWDDTLIEHAVCSPRRAELIAAAVGADDLRWISGYVSAKEPRSPALWWHQDWWCWDHPVSFEPQAPQIAVLCYLDATSATTGALRVLPGSHRRSLPLHAALPEAHARMDGLDPAHPAMTDQPRQATLAVRAGDAIVVDYRLLHGTHPNTAARRRDCLVLTYAPSWLRLPAAIRAHLIRHPAQPSRRERPQRTDARRLLPTFAGRARDLPLNRIAPSEFAIGQRPRPAASAAPARL